MQSIDKGMKQLNVILDLDQTLISAEELSTFDPKRYKKKLDSLAHKRMEDLFIVFARPGLQEFLDYLFENFNVSVWTAATKNYALFIIDHFITPKSKPNRKLDFIFYSYHSEYSEKEGSGLKDISILWKKFGLTKYNRLNTIIIDDNPYVKHHQVCNCFSISPFYAKRVGSENDTHLSKLQASLENLRIHLQKLNQKGDECIAEKL